MDNLSPSPHRRKVVESSEKIIRLGTVKARCGLSRSTLYNRIAAGEFPSPVALGARAVGWVESEISAWIASRIDASRNPRRIINAHAESRLSKEQ